MSQVQDLYSAHFGMTARPFSPLADASSFYAAPSHARATGAVQYGLVAGAAVTVLTGPAGTGKTSLLLRLAAEAPADVHLAMVGGARPDAPSIVPWILHAMAVETSRDADEVTQFDQLQTALIAEYAAGRRVQLIFDEAQGLSDAALDEIRLLTNINTAQDQLLQIVLAGQPQLRDRLLSDRHSALSQRVGAWAVLDLLDAGQTQPYIAARLAGVDAPVDLFEADCIPILHEATAGVPRLLNQLCELGLIYAMTDGADQVSSATLRAVLNDGLFVSPPTPPVFSGTQGHLRVAGGAR